MNLKSLKLISWSIFISSIVILVFLDSKTTFVNVNQDVALWLSYVKLHDLDPTLIYFKDIFEINFPASMLIYQPIYFISNWLEVPYKITIYVFVYASLLLSAALVSNVSKTWGYIIFAAGSLTILFESYSLGEREIFIIFLLVPYAFFLYFNKFNGYRELSILLAVFATLVKPFYTLGLLMLFIYKLYHLYNKRALKLFKRTLIDIPVSIIFLGLFIWLLWILFPEYMDTILLLQEYRSVISTALPKEIFVLAFFASIYIGFLFLLGYIDKRPLLSILLVGFSLAVIIQNKYFGYHFIPIIFIFNAFLIYLLYKYKTHFASLVFFAIIYLPIISINLFTIENEYRNTYNSIQLTTSIIDKEKCNKDRTIFFDKINISPILTLEENITGLKSPSSLTILTLTDPRYSFVYPLVQKNYKLIQKDLKQSSCVFVSDELRKKYPGLFFNFDKTEKFTEIKAGGKKINYFLYKGKDLN